jgi:hypothetical protein
MTARSRCAAALATVGLVGALAAALGAPVRATYGARTAADEPQYLLTALSLGTDGNLDIADELAAEDWRAFHEASLPEQTRPLPGGRRVSPHDPLLPLVLAAPMALGGWLAAKLALALVAGLTAAATCWLAVRGVAVPLRVAAPVTALFAASVPLAPYGSQVYPELPAALAVVVAVGALLGPLRTLGLGALAAAVVALPWLATKYVPVAVALALLGLVRAPRRRAVGLAVVLAVAGVGFLAAHQVLYGGWTPYAAGDHFVERGEFSAVGFTPNLLGRSRRLVGLLVDGDFGLAAWQPAWLVAVPAVAALARRRPAGWQVLLAPLAAGWLTASFVALTMHGWWFPGRQVVVVAPLAVVAVAWLAARRRVVLAATVTLGVWGVWSYAWLLADGLSGRIAWIVDFAATRDPLYRVWSSVLPDYLRPGTRMWLLHAVWVVAAGAGVAWGWRLERSRAPGAPAYHGRVMRALVPFRLLAATVGRRR